MKDLAQQGEPVGSCGGNEFFFQGSNSMVEIQEPETFLYKKLSVDTHDLRVSGILPQGVGCFCSHFLCS